MDSTKQVQINSNSAGNKNTFFTYNRGNMTQSKEKDKIIMIPKWQNLNKRQNVNPIIRWSYVPWWKGENKNCQGKLLRVDIFYSRSKSSLRACKQLDKQCCTHSAFSYHIKDRTNPWRPKEQIKCINLKVGKKITFKVIPHPKHRAEGQMTKHQPARLSQGSCKTQAGMWTDGKLLRH